MTLTIELTPAQETRLARVAARHNLQLTDFVQQLVVNSAPASESAGETSLWNALAPDEWSQHVDEWLQSLPAVPVLSEYGVSRVSFYEERP